jgi:beta-1,4-mannosyltransferase
MKKAYLYPLSARYKKESQNPYLDNFMDSLSDEFNFINRQHPSSSGILDIFRYLGKTDFIFLHWPENMAEKKGGIIQSILFIMLIPLLGIIKIRLIYVLHNKISHTNNRYRIKKAISIMLMKYSYKIITHSKEGINFINSMVRAKTDIFYFPHPIVDERPFPKTEKDLDILIWGNIAPYKGIHNFLKKLKESGHVSDWQILIAGKVSSPDYLEELLSAGIENLTIVDEFLDDERLNRLICRSRIVVFPYQQESILSSGAFAKTSIFPVEIIGPSCGSFIDFNNIPNVHTFNSEEEIVPLIQNILAKPLSIKYEHLDDMTKKFSWESFGIEFGKSLKPMP